MLLGGGGNEGKKTWRLSIFLYLFLPFLKVKISHNLENLWPKSGRPVNYSVVLVLCICSHFPHSSSLTILFLLAAHLPIPSCCVVHLMQWHCCWLHWGEKKPHKSTAEAKYSRWLGDKTFSFPCSESVAAPCSVETGKQYHNDCANLLLPNFFIFIYIGN